MYSQAITIKRPNLKNFGEVIRIINIKIGFLSKAFLYIIRSLNIKSLK